MAMARPPTKQMIVPGGGFQVSALAAGVVAAFALSLATAGAVALVVYTTAVSEQAASALLFATGLLSLTVAAAYGARLAGSLGWVHGLAIGVVYVLATMAVTPFLFPGVLTFAGALQRLALGAACGALGGVVGINLLR
jgi:putative membrane protein (TIGR04086 family)